jgi:hypothetical protein
MYLYIHFPIHLHGVKLNYLNRGTSDPMTRTIRPPPNHRLNHTPFKQLVSTGRKITVGSKSTRTILGTCFPQALSLKNGLKQWSLPLSRVLSEVIWPSNWIPCSRQYNSQQALQTAPQLAQNGLRYIHAEAKEFYSHFIILWNFQLPDSTWMAYESSCSTLLVSNCIMLYFYFCNFIRHNSHKWVFSSHCDSLVVRRCSLL